MRTGDVETLERLVAWRRAGHAVQLVTVLSTWGSAPRPPGAFAIVRDDGAVAGSVSGGCIERQLVEHRADAPGVGTLQVSDALARGVGLTCGGRIELLFEPIEPIAPFETLLAALAQRRTLVREVDVATGSARLLPGDGASATGWDGSVLRRRFGPDWRVLLIGAGELSQHVARFALAVDFDVVVCEPRAPFRSAFDIDIVPLLDLLPDEAVDACAHDVRSAVLALTHEPTLDDLALEQALAADCFHVGALGSRRSHDKRRARLAALGVPPDAIDRISAPVGLDIGSRTAAEIALSVVAELVARRAAIG